MKRDSLIIFMVIAVFVSSSYLLSSFQRQDSITGMQVAEPEENASATFSDKLNQTLEDIQPSKHIPLKMFNTTVYFSIGLITILFIFLELRKLQPIQKEIDQGMAQLNVDFEDALRHYRNANSMLKASSHHTKRRYAEKMRSLYNLLNQKKDEVHNA